MTTSNDSYLYDNEPDNVYTGDGSAIESYVQSGGFVSINNKWTQYSFIDRIILIFLGIWECDITS